MATLTKQKTGLSLKLALGLVGAVLVFLYGEITLAAPIIFFTDLLGFWAAYVLICVGMTVIALATLLVVERRYGKGKGSSEVANPDWKQRIAMRALGVAKVFGFLATAAVLGPVFGSPLLRVLGYSRRSYYAFAFGSPWFFGAIWVPAYGLGVWGLGLSRLF